MTKKAMTEITHRDEFVKLIDELDLKVGVEIGVDEGKFSDWILSNSKLDVLHGVDAWSTDTEKTKSPYAAWSSDRMAARKQDYSSIEVEARKRLAKHGIRSKLIKDISWDAACQFEDNSIDFIYFDASHTKEGFLKDLESWYSKIRVGGLMAGHDYYRKRGYGVIEVVDKFLPEHGLAFHVTGEKKSPSWWTIKEK
jgi:hypothetical protein